MVATSHAKRKVNPPPGDEPIPSIKKRRLSCKTKVVEAPRPAVADDGGGVGSGPAVAEDSGAGAPGGAAGASDVAAGASDGGSHPCAPGARPQRRQFNGKGDCASIFKKLAVLDWLANECPASCTTKYAATMARFPETVTSKGMISRWKRASRKGRFGD